MRHQQAGGGRALWRGLVVMLCFLGCASDGELLAPQANYLPVRLIYASRIAQRTQDVVSRKEQLAREEAEEQAYADRLNEYGKEIDALEGLVGGDDASAQARKDELIAAREQAFADYHALIARNQGHRADIKQWQEEIDALASGHCVVHRVSVRNKDYVFPAAPTTRYALPLDLNSDSVAFRLNTSIGTFSLRVRYELTTEVVYRDELLLRTIFRESTHHSFDSIRAACAQQTPCYTNDMLLSLYF